MSQREITRILNKPLSLEDREEVIGFTIDGETSKDLDDAIWVEPNQAKANISVHISDVSAFIEPGSNLERNALSQVETRYLATKNDPMFPHELSEDRLSLLEAQRRLTITVRITIDALGDIEKVSLHRTHLVNLKKFSYTSADATLKDASSPFFCELRYCEAWAQKLAWKRKDVGAIGLSRLGGISLDEEGRILSTPLYHSQQIIQEFMILANMAVASLAEQQQVPLLYRNHLASDIAPKSKELIQTLNVLGLPELVRQKLQSWLKPATYSPAVMGHFALALPAYTHFTSPIRRVADYVNHHIVKAVLIDKTESPYTIDELQDIASHINEKRSQIKERREEHFREKRLNQTIKVLQEKSQIKTLSDQEFSQILKDSIKVSQLDKLVPEALWRIEEKTIKLVDLYYLIFGEYNKYENKQLLTSKILDYLSENPVHATQIVQMAGSINQTTVEYIEKKTASGKFAFWSILEGETTATPGIAANKQTAKHQGNMLLIESIFDQSLIPPQLINEDYLQDMVETEVREESKAIKEVVSEPEIEELELSGVPEAAKLNPVGYLHEIGQRLKRKKPQYVYHQVGLQWQCCCRIEWLGENIVETLAINSSKK
ncbi:ribonuclease catalytic domain-containing protein, partial [Crocosphaera watsonii]|uniref:ribonuclease catalytic domain-containing protein n=1 Tax=Crocosphaera watsonii TaxID=263511 RepID=UPI00065FB10C